MKLLSAQKSNLFHKILLPTDGSDHSLKAARYAAELVRISGLEVTLMTVLIISDEDHPIEIFPDSWLAPPLDEVKIKERGMQVIEDTKKFFDQNKISVNIKYFTCGHPSQAILDIAENENFDLIIMGSQGLGGFKRLMLGSVADRVSRHASCPVFIIR